MQKLIYIADDEQNIRQMMKAFWESEGYAIEVFSNGAEIRRAVRQKTPDMIILDVMMPGEDGFSLCTSFRRESGIPIMIVSQSPGPRHGNYSGKRRLYYKAVSPAGADRTRKSAVQAGGAVGPAGKSAPGAVRMRQSGTLPEGEEGLCGK